MRTWFWMVLLALGVVGLVALTLHRIQTGEQAARPAVPMPPVTPLVPGTPTTEAPGSPRSAGLTPSATPAVPASTSPLSSTADVEIRWTLSRKLDLTNGADVLNLTGQDLQGLVVVLHLVSGSIRATWASHGRPGGHDLTPREIAQSVMKAHETGDPSAHRAMMEAAGHGPRRLIPAGGRDHFTIFGHTVAPPVVSLEVRDAADRPLRVQQTVYRRGVGRIY